MGAMAPVATPYEDLLRHVLEHGTPKSDRTGTGTRSVQGGGSDVVRTATFFVEDFEAPRQGMEFDFSLKSGGNTPFMFVRLIKLDASVASASPRPPENIAVD